MVVGGKKLKLQGRSSSPLQFSSSSSSSSSVVVLQAHQRPEGDQEAPTVGIIAAAAGAAGGGMRKGPWTEQEDVQLVWFVRLLGERRWDFLAKVSGLQRSGKSCRLRWVNYLHPGLKRGRMSPEEERMVVQLHAKLGNRWSRIAKSMPGRTDNEIKNYWRTHLRKLKLQATQKQQHKQEAATPSDDDHNSSFSSSSSNNNKDSSMQQPASLHAQQQHHQQQQDQQLSSFHFQLPLWNDDDMAMVDVDCWSSTNVNVVAPAPASPLIWDDAFCSDYSLSLWGSAHDTSDYIN